MFHTNQVEETPLHIAARIKDGDKVAEMLIKSGADVNAPSDVRMVSFIPACFEFCFIGKRGNGRIKLFYVVDKTVLSSHISKYGISFVSCGCQFTVQASTLSPIILRNYTVPV